MLHAAPFPTLVAAGVINASFALPMKFMRKWSWENIWLVWAVFGLIIFPIALGCLKIPGFVGLFAVSGKPALVIAAFGALWGVGQVLFGFALESIGISLSTAIMLGISTAVGTLVPLIATGGGSLPALRVFGLIGGVVLSVGGVILCAHAGNQREPEARDVQRGIAFAVAAGFGAGLFNFAMAFGGQLIEKALQAGSSPGFAQLAAWTPFLLAGALANVGYCGFRLVRQRTFLQFGIPGAKIYWFGAMLMAVLWLGSALLYGLAAKQMGRLGPIFAWPVYMSLIVSGTAMIGVLAGEWRAASRGIVIMMSGGIGALLIAVFVISSAQRGF
jgi:L-rhamnose-H+ transport protein